MNVKKTGEQLSEISVTGPGININVKQGLIIPITTNGSFAIWQMALSLVSSRKVFNPYTK